MKHVVKPKIGDFVWCHYDRKRGLYCPGRCINRVGSEFVIQLLPWPSYGIREPGETLILAFHYDTMPNKIYGDINRNVKRTRNPYALKARFHPRSRLHYYIYNRPDLEDQKKIDQERYEFLK
jgi:hypothetical protein